MAGTRRRVNRRAADLLAAVVVLAALLLPNGADRLSVVAFVALPLEAVLAAAVLLVIPPRLRRPLAGALGGLLGALTVLTVLDLAFSVVLARAFDPVLDWELLPKAEAFVVGALGGVGAVAVTVLATGLVGAVLVLVTWSSLRLERLLTQHRTFSTSTTVVLATLWLSCAGTGLVVAPGVPLAARSSAALTHSRVDQVVAGLRDRRSFAAESGRDPFRETPSAQLLTGLRGRDVVLAFVESYGRDALEDPALASEVGAVLASGNQRLEAAGFASRSAFLTSSTVGGGSWLAHATLQSGLWVDDEQRYRTLLASNRLTLTDAFGRAGWRTVGVLPGTTRAWPEGHFFGYDRVYDQAHLGYHGPPFNWAAMPDQYTMAAFERLEHARSPRRPVMAEIQLTSSHAPWRPVPAAVDWRDVGDGSAFDPQVQTTEEPESILGREPSRVRSDYRRAIGYSLQTLLSYVETYGDDDLVLIFLGDHQPSPVVTGSGASRDVPITLLTRDQSVLDRVSGWGWQQGLAPGPTAPVWRMDAFRDRFLTTFAS